MVGRYSPWASLLTAWVRPLPPPRQRYARTVALVCRSLALLILLLLLAYPLAALLQ
jgi:hypothetical protein